MSSFIEELKSGNGTVYAQWGALLSILFLVIGFFSNILSMLILFAFISLGMAFVMILLELPIFQKCCPTGPKMQAFIKYFEGNYLRAVLYVGFSVIMWVSLTVEKSFAFIVAGITTLFSAFCYAFAGVKNQERKPSALTGANLGPGSLL
ncbi:hypothetical protein BCR44DRAFT_41085 [Catenaria anguillulae PL171]|uniref:Golgi apparatus membrane protein TVP18 n=1 Tax=Catenaria anguillulae PL171 TaxID=765915 RepID=A0A1Y2HHK9_9FUNG|nr:hypothetical protein BCR44DRAFT_41085 [Catenaria anguillulae PL171]